MEGKKSIKGGSGGNSRRDISNRKGSPKIVLNLGEYEIDQVFEEDKPPLLLDDL